VTLHVDEPQLALQSQQISALKEMAVYHIKHVVISGMLAKDAMLQLCQEIQRHSGYDYLIKLDADMTFRDLDSLGVLIRRAKVIGKPRYTVSVYDHSTKMNIFGLHIVDISSVGHTNSITELNRDDWLGQIAGDLVILKKPLIDHCVNPTDLQLYTFGYNRGIKNKLKKQNVLPILVVSAFNCLFDRRYKLVIKGFFDGYEKSKPQFNSADVKSGYFQKQSVKWSVLIFFLKNNILQMPKAILLAIYFKLK
jgi:hypothetical protein